MKNKTSTVLIAIILLAITYTSTSKSSQTEPEFARIEPKIQNFTEEKSQWPSLFSQYPGCIACHEKITQSRGITPNIFNTIILMDRAHDRDTGISLLSTTNEQSTYIFEDCFACHLSNLDRSFDIHKSTLETSILSFSHVIHNWHIKNPAVQEFEPDIARDCSICHRVMVQECFITQHSPYGLWCTDCHVEIDQIGEKDVLPLGLVQK